MNLTTIATILTVTNCREKTESHKDQKGLAKRPFESMVSRGKAGLPLWDPAHPAKVLSLYHWLSLSKINCNRTIDDAIEKICVSGNCRLKTFPDAIDALKVAGIKLKSAQLLIPFEVIDDQIESTLDMIARQIGDNEIVGQRIPLSDRSKIATALRAKKAGLNWSRKSMVDDLKLTGDDAQRIYYASQLWDLVPVYKDRITKAENEVTDDLLPLKSMPHHDINKLVSPLHKLWRKDKTVKLGALAKDVEALIQDSLAGKLKRKVAIRANQWETAAEEYESDSIFKVLANGVTAGSFDGPTDAIGDILSASVVDATRWMEQGRAVEEVKTVQEAEQIACDAWKAKAKVEKAKVEKAKAEAKAKAKAEKAKAEKAKAKAKA